jgi:UDPglucose 6-dehydrogenase
VGLGQLGHDIVGIDIDESKVRSLSDGISPIFEAGMDEALATLLIQKKISFTSRIEEVKGANPEFIFLCVATPQDQTGAADLSTLFSVANQLAGLAPKDSVLVIKSTVPVGTGSKLSKQIKEKEIFLASNPEFLREGTALKDFTEPDRVVVGANEADVAERVLELYQGLHSTKLSTNLQSAELIKYASNAYLAMRLSFTNDMANFTEKVNANVDDVLLGLGLDSRIGSSFLKPGPGWGGSCFPKDTRALLAMASQHGVSLPLVQSSLSSNQEAMLRVVDKIEELAGGHLANKTVAIWGLAFKANTDDVRDSPSVFIINTLLQRGARVQAYDPAAIAAEQSGLTSFDSGVEAARGADVLAVLTEWQEFAELSPDEVSGVMKSAVVFDARRILPGSWKSKAKVFSVIGEP